ncbi:MAG: 3-hydroxyacyl-ACP dehydratase FabZ [Candidatus Sericytochromatia bacterium]|nr:3-hydroxyacyl-ACP dehydratase FabZ [Candidatus Sericytochromatia bacterium]
MSPDVLGPLEADDLMAMLPHRFPFLLVDRVLELVPGVRAKALKNVTVNEPFFQGHFPGRSLMPGVLMVEALAQVAGLTMLAMPEHRGRLAVLAGVDGCRFRRMVRPGDTLIIETEVLKFRSHVGVARATAWVDGQRVTEGELMFSLVER